MDLITEKYWEVVKARNSFDTLTEAQSGMEIAQGRWPDKTTTRVIADLPFAIEEANAAVGNKLYEYLTVYKTWLHQQSLYDIGTEIAAVSRERYKDGTIQQHIDKQRKLVCLAVLQERSKLEG